MPRSFWARLCISGFQFFAFYFAIYLVDTRSNSYATVSRKIAIVLNLSAENPFARVESKFLKYGFDYAIEKYAHLLAEHHLAVEYIDDHGTTEGAVVAGKYLSERNDIALVISGYTSKVAVPLSQSLKNKFFIYTFASSVGPLSNENLHLRLTGDNDSQGAEMYRFARDRYHLKKACVIAESNDGFSIAIKRGIVEESKKDPSLQKFSNYSFLGDTRAEITQTLDECLQIHPDVIFHSGRSSSARLFLNYYFEKNIQVPIIASDGWGDYRLVLDGENFKYLKERNPAVHIAYFWDSRPKKIFSSDFYNLMQKKYEMGGSLIPLGHDAVVVAMTILFNETVLRTQGVEKNIHRVKPVVPLFLLEKDQRIQALVPAKIYRLHPDGFY